AHQPAGGGKFPEWIHRRHLETRSRSNYLLAPDHKERVGANKEPIGTLLGERCESRIDFLRRSGADDLQFEPIAWVALCTSRSSGSASGLAALTSMGMSLILGA